MDRKLVAWARRVKTRRRTRVPLLWLFTDRRLAEPADAVRALARIRPRSLCGVVIRGDAAERQGLATLLAPLCRRSGLAMLVAADPVLAARIGAGLHLPGGRRPVRRLRPGILLSASAHGISELHRARRAGVDLVFISPVFPTASHPEARPLGRLRATSLAAHARRGLPIALGGINGGNVRALPPCFAGAGAIDALGR